LKTFYSNKKIRNYKMLVKKAKRVYSSQRKYIHGKGFVDTVKPILSTIGNFISQNKDLIAKPLLGAVGSLAATGGKALLTKILNRQQNKNTSNSGQEMRNQNKDITPKGQEILNNIIGSGIKAFYK